MDYNVDPDEIDHRGAFFVEQDGARVAQTTYSRVNPSLVIIDHTEAAPSLGGRGIGRRLDTAVSGLA